MQATTPRIAPVFVCCLFIRMLVSAEDGTQGLGHAKQLFHHLAAHAYFSRRQNSVCLNSNLKDFRVHVANISKKWILLVTEEKIVDSLKKIQNQVKTNDF